MTAVKGPGVVSQPGAVAIEPARRRIRVLLGGQWIADSDDAVTLFEHGFTPRWYIPRRDVRPGILVPNGEVVDTLGRGPARWYDVTIGERVVKGAAWDHPSPPPDCPPLDGLVSFEWNLMDGWFEEDDEVFVHPRDPYTRVDVLSSSRHVRVELNGTPIAQTHRPLLVIETTAPTRYYIPWLDVDHRVVQPSDSFTLCPYKGRASYWHVVVGDTVYRDVLWGYREPLAPVARIAGHVAAFNEFVELWVDGVLLDRPDSKWAYGGPNAYTSRPGDERWNPARASAWRGDDPSVHR
jgi:uncharacterized protein (DUF427 family)